MTAITAGGLVLLGFAVLVGVVALGTRMVSSARAGTTIRSLGGGLGAALEIYDPAAEHQRRERERQASIGAIIPSPADDDRPLRVDLITGRAILRPERRGPTPRTEPPPPVHHV